MKTTTIRCPRHATFDLAANVASSSLAVVGIKSSCSAPAASHTTVCVATAERLVFKMNFSFEAFGCCITFDVRSANHGRRHAHCHLLCDLVQLSR